MSYTPEQLAKPNTEHAHQVALFAAINQKCFELTNAGWNTAEQVEQLQLLFAIPNGGDRHKATAGRMKAEGVKSGVWDLCLPVSRQRNKDIIADGFYNGLWIEMKEPGRRNHHNGGLSDEQLKFGRAMEKNGYDCHVCYTWEEAYDTVLEYLGIAK